MQTQDFQTDETLTLTLPPLYDSLQSTLMHSANHVALTPIAFLSRTADVYPERTSLIYGEQQYTWRETEKRCQQMAHALQNLGLKPHETVSALLFNTPEMSEAHFSVPLAGGVLNTINTRLDSDTISYILNFAETRILLVDRELLPNALPGLRQCQQQGQEIQVILVDDPTAAQQPAVPSDLNLHDFNQLLAQTPLAHADYLPTRILNELQPLAINFTSGTSGRPKGVVYHHRGSYLMSMGTIAGWPVPMHPVYLSVVPLFHCNGWGHTWAMTAMAATIVCTRNVVPKRLFELIQEQGVTHMGGAPIVLNMLANSPDCPKHIAKDRVVHCMTAGAPPPAAVLGRMEAIGFDIMHVYGLTETYGHILQCAPQDAWCQDSPEAVAELKARQGVRFPIVDGIQVLNPKTLKPVANDGEEMGEILIRANSVMSGYLKDPEATEQSFRDGWFHSGDLAVVHPDGYIQVKDRAKDIIISGGENISSVEIESALYKHPCVGDAAVVAMPDEKWGETPCAFVELKPGREADEQALIEHCTQHLASFKKPGKVVFGPLPKTATGKIQKFALRKQFR